jgi:hypothetical protein
LGIASEGLAHFMDFLKDFGDRFKPEDWVDAFGWFQISLHCLSCQTSYPEWVDYETM